MTYATGDHGTVREPRPDVTPLAFFRVEVRLQIRRATRLRAHHGPVLYALLAAAYGGGGRDPLVPDGLMLDAPEQCRIELMPGEAYHFGFTLIASSAAAASATTAALVEGLRRLGRDSPDRRVALGGNFDLDGARDLVAGRDWNHDSPLEPVPFAHIVGEARRLSAGTSLTLRFTSPLRCPRPDAARTDGHAWFDAGYFDAAGFVGRVARRLRDLGIPAAFVPPTGLRTLENRLVWLDLAYGGEGGKSLGGGVGRVTLTCPCPLVAEVLAWGQHARLGQNTRFGFGAYRIEELGLDPFACRRSGSLLDPALHSAELERAAAELDVPSGTVTQFARAIACREYRPAPSFRMQIRTAGGHARTLSIPSRADRALQRAVLRYLGPALDRLFEDSSFAYRKGLARGRAARRVREAAGRGYRFALRADFARFFDSIDHQRLRDRLEAYLADDQTVELLMAWVREGSPFEGRGLPTGAPLSPLLANVFLDGFDEEIAAGGAVLVRYADDFLVLYRTAEEAQRVFAAATEAAAVLELQLNDEKTGRVAMGEPFEFLGYRFERRDRWVKMPTGQAAAIEDIGWKDARRPEPSEAPLARLPGESEGVEPSEQAWVILGPGAQRVWVEAGRLICTYPGGSSEPVPLERVRDVIVLGDAEISASTLRRLAERDARLLLADDSGHIRGCLLPDEGSEDAEAVAAQFDAARDERWRLAVARRLVSAKIWNYAALADAMPGPALDRQTGPALREFAARAQQAGSVDVLLGIEGAAAAKWYRALPQRLPAWCRFTRRVAPDAEDPVNVMLNMAQTALHRQMVLALRGAGLSPALGIFHVPRSGHAALASDLQEAFRHLMDRAVLQTVSSLRPADFHADPAGPYALAISPGAVRKLVAVVHRSFMLASACEQRPEPRRYLMHFSIAARSLRRNLLDRSQSFEVFRHPPLIVPEKRPVPQPSGGAAPGSPAPAGPSASPAESEAP